MGIIYLFMPVIMGILGFVCFVVFAVIYNLLAKWPEELKLKSRPLTSWPKERSGVDAGRASLFTFLGVRPGATHREC